MGERLSARGIGPNGVDVVFPTPIARERNAVAFGRPGWEDCVSPTYGERPDHVCLNVDNEQSDPTVLRHTLDESPSMWGPIRQTVVAVPSVMFRPHAAPVLGVIDAGTRPGPAATGSSSWSTRSCEWCSTNLFCPLHATNAGKPRFTVIYRSRPAFQIVPVDDKGGAPISLAEDPLYRAEAVGSSDDGRTSIDHDAILYPR